MSANRSKQLTQALDAIHRRWGSEVLRPLAGLASPSVCIPTGYSDLDRVINGGIPCGQITELSGAPTCGVTTLALKVVAQAQLRGRLGVYIDLARSFDPGYAVHCGVQLEGLLIARPEDPAGALDILQLVAEEGGPCWPCSIRSLGMTGEPARRYASCHRRSGGRAVPLWCSTLGGCCMTTPTPHSVMSFPHRRESTLHAHGFPLMNFDKIIR